MTNKEFIKKITNKFWFAPQHFDYKKKAKTRFELDTQSLKVCLLNHFIAMIKAAVHIGFKQHHRLAFQSAFKYNMKQMLIGDYPDMSLDYSAMLISKGKLPGFDHPKLSLFTRGEGYLSWQPNEGRNGTDRVYILLFNVTRDKVLHSAYAGERSDRGVNFKLQKFEEKDELHCWVFFDSPVDPDVSASNYIQDVTVWQ